MTNGNGAPPEAAPPPQLSVLAQYTKDLSFENPNAPASLAPQPQQPAINIQINVSANNVSENEFEVTLSIEGKAENAGKLMFSFDLAYAGVFRIVNIPKENLHPLVMIECRPRRENRARAFSVPMESERRLYFFVLTRFLDANRYPPRIASGAGFA